MAIFHIYPGDVPDPDIEEDIENVWDTLRLATTDVIDCPFVTVITPLHIPSARQDIIRKLAEGEVDLKRVGFLEPNEVTQHITSPKRELIWHNGEQSVLGQTIQETTFGDTVEVKKKVPFNLRSEADRKRIREKVKGAKDIVVVYFPAEDYDAEFNWDIAMRQDVYIFHFPTEGKYGVLRAESGTSRPPAVISKALDFAKRQFKPMEVMLEVKDSKSAVLHHPTAGEIHSERGVGKSHFAIGMLEAIATGGDYLCYHAPVALPVVYVDGEMAGSDLQEILGKGCENFNVISIEEQPDYVIPSIAVQEGCDWIEAGAASCEAKVICLDNWSTLANIGTNEEEAWQVFMAWIKKMRLKGITVFYLHHDGKTGKQRGHSKPEDLLNWVIQLKWKDGYKGAEGLKCFMHFEKARRPVKQCSRLNIELDENVWSYSLPGEEELDVVEKPKGRPAVQPEPFQIMWLQSLEAKPPAAQVQKEFSVSRSVAERWIKDYVKITRTPGELEARFVPGAFVEEKTDE